MLIGHKTMSVISYLLLMQLREAVAEKEDLKVQNNLLQKRLDKAKALTPRGSFSK